MGRKDNEISNIHVDTATKYKCNDCGGEFLLDQSFCMEKFFERSEHSQECPYCGHSKELEHIPVCPYCGQSNVKEITEKTTVMDMQRHLNQRIDAIFGLMDYREKKHKIMIVGFFATYWFYELYKVLTIYH